MSRRRDPQPHPARTAELRIADGRLPIVAVTETGFRVAAPDPRRLAGQRAGTVAVASEGISLSIPIAIAAVVPGPDGCVDVVPAPGSEAVARALAGPDLPEIGLLALRPVAPGRTRQTAGGTDAVRRRGWSFGLAAACCVLLAFCLAELYVKLYVTPVVMATVAIDQRVLAAPRGGRVGFLAAGDTVEAGEIVAGITTVSGGSVLIESACACEVVHRPAPEGALVRRGEAVLVLAPRGAERHLNFTLPLQDAVRIGAGWRWEAVFAGRPPLSGAVDAGGIRAELASPGPTPSAGSAPSEGPLVFRLSTGLPVDTPLGSAATLRFFRSPSDLVAATMDRLGVSAVMGGAGA